MRIVRDGKHSGIGEKAKLAILSADEQTKRMQQAIACRAYEIFKTRGTTSRHELEDWRQAEAELVSPLCCGRTTVDGSIWIGADAAAFQEGTIEIWVAPRKITICGKPRREKVDARRQHIGTHSEKAMIFHVLDLPVEIDPSGATVKFNGPSLELLLRKAQAKPPQLAQFVAA